MAWQAALHRADGPTCLILSRQALKPFVRNAAQKADMARGGYVLEEPAGGGMLQAVLIATGSEVGIASAAAALLAARGIGARVVSMPCVELFHAQDQAYRDGVLPPGVPRISMEAGVTWFWRGVVGDGGVALGIDSFGESAPADQLYAHFGLTAQAMADAATARVNR